jgi:hypothetical protein
MAGQQEEIQKLFFLFIIDKKSNKNESKSEGANQNQR